MPVNESLVSSSFWYWYDLQIRMPCPSLASLGAGMKRRVGAMSKPGLIGRRHVSRNTWRSRRAGTWP